MLVSVITPCYNSAPYIAQAVESVRAQSFRNWELIIADDCSADGSAAIARLYARKDRRIRFLQTPSHSGSPLRPRNLALEHAAGRYIAFLDSDDIWLPGKLERQLALFGSCGENTAVVFSDYEKIREDGGRSGRAVRAPAAADYRRLLKGNCIGNLTAVYDTAKTGKVFFRHPRHEDYVLWLDILGRGFLAENTGTVEALRRVRAGSVSAGKAAAAKWQWDIYRKRLKLPLLSSLYFFCSYLAKGVLKHFK
jgi:glycosyltransferase involved in cell wall biosynthesis